MFSENASYKNYLGTKEMFRYKTILLKSKRHFESLTSAIFIVIKLITISKRPKNQFNYLLLKREELVSHRKHELDQSVKEKSKTSG